MATIAALLLFLSPAPQGPVAQPQSGDNSPPPSLPGPVSN